MVDCFVEWAFPRPVLTSFRGDIGDIIVRKELPPTERAREEIASEANRAIAKAKRHHRYRAVILGLVGIAVYHFAGIFWVQAYAAFFGLEVLAREAIIDRIAFHDVTPDTPMNDLRFQRAWNNAILSNTLSIGAVCLVGTVLGHYPALYDVAIDIVEDYLLAY